MILSEATIKQHVQDGLISIAPYFDERQLRPFGLRVHLGDEILIPEPGQSIDLSVKNPQEPTFRRVNINPSRLTLRPGDFVLGSTVESFKIHPTLTCRIDGRSTLARLGLIIHCTAEIIDNIHKQHRSIVLEMANVGAFELTIPYLYAIGMAIFETVSSPIDPNKEQNQYENQRTVTPPNLDFETPDYL